MGGGRIFDKGFQLTDDNFTPGTSPLYENLIRVRFENLKKYDFLTQVGETFFLTLFKSEETEEQIVYDSFEGIGTQDYFTISKLDTNLTLIKCIKSDGNPKALNLPGLMFFHNKNFRTKRDIAAATASTVITFDKAGVGIPFATTCDFIEIELNGKIVHLDRSRGTYYKAGGGHMVEQVIFNSKDSDNMRLITNIQAERFDIRTKTGNFYDIAPTAIYLGRY